MNTVQINIILHNTHKLIDLKAKAIFHYDKIFSRRLITPIQSNYSYDL